MGLTGAGLGAGGEPEALATGVLGTTGRVGTTLGGKLGTLGGAGGGTKGEPEADQLTSALATGVLGGTGGVGGTGEGEPGT